MNEKLYTPLGCLEYGLRMMKDEAKFFQKVIMKDFPDPENRLTVRQYARYLKDFEDAIKFLKGERVPGLWVKYFQQLNSKPSVSTDPSDSIT